MVIDEEKFDKLKNLERMLGKLGETIAITEDRKIYRHHGMIWHFKYRTHYNRTYTKQWKDCILSIKDWEEYPISESDDVRWTLTDIIKETVKARQVLSGYIDGIDNFNIPDSGSPNALYEGNRFNDDHNIFMRIRHGYQKHALTLVEAVKAALKEAANWDWYDKYERE